MSQHYHSDILVSHDHEFSDPNHSHRPQEPHFPVPTFPNPKPHRAR